MEVLGGVVTAVALDHLVSFFAKQSASLAGEARSNYFANGERCTRLAARLLRLQPAITAIGAKAEVTPAERAFAETAARLAEDATEFCAQFRGKGTGAWGFICKAVQARTDQLSFAELNQRINELSLDIALDVNAQAWAQEDEKDGQADGAELATALHEMQEQQSAYHYELLDAISALEIAPGAAAAAAVVTAAGGGGELQQLLSMYDYEPDEDEAWLGAGAFGDVYRMKSKTDGEIRAIKMVAMRKVKQFGVAEGALMREAKAMLRLHHSNIVRYFSSHAHGRGGSRSFCLVMELADGGSVYEWLEKARRGAAPIAMGRIVSWMAQIGAGLHHMHVECRMIHRDLKPHNLLLTSDGGSIKIADLGMACADATSMVHSKQGTNIYMSPEKAAGLKYGPPDDMWGAGCVLFELLTLTVLARFVPGGLYASPEKIAAAVTSATGASTLLGMYVQAMLEMDPALRLSSSQLRHVGRAAEQGDRYEPSPVERLRREAAERARAQAEADGADLLRQKQEMEREAQRLRLQQAELRRKMEDEEQARRLAEQRLDRRADTGEVTAKNIGPKLLSRVRLMQEAGSDSEHIEQVLGLESGSLTLLDRKNACMEKLEAASVQLQGVVKRHEDQVPKLQAIEQDLAKERAQHAAARERQRTAEQQLEAANARVNAEAVGIDEWLQNKVIENECAIALLPSDLKPSVYAQLEKRAVTEIQPRVDGVNRERAMVKQQADDLRAAAKETRAAEQATVARAATLQSDNQRLVQLRAEVSAAREALRGLEEQLAVALEQAEPSEAIAATASAAEEILVRLARDEFGFVPFTQAPSARADPMVLTNAGKTAASPRAQSSLLQTGGMLQKRGKMLKSWKNKFFRIAQAPATGDVILSQYADAQSVETKATLTITGVSRCIVMDDAEALTLRSEGQTWHLRARSPEEAEQWARLLRGFVLSPHAINRMPCAWHSRATLTDGSAWDGLG
eukprot:g1753.t1